MKPDSPKPTPAEKKFDRTREEAFSNEGAPPPARASLIAANADQWGVVEGRAAASALRSVSTDVPASACGPAGETADETPSPNAPVKDATHARRSNGEAVVGVCALLSDKLPRRSGG
jgi:hypothetical protein